MLQYICIKHHVSGNWLSSSEDEVLSSMTSENNPLDKHQKSQLPVFGFNKLIDQKSNAQQFPVQQIILELDTPIEIKKKIQNGDTRAFRVMQGKFWMWFNQFKHDPNLNYCWMYLTPSTCGIRFVLKLDRAVGDKEEYIHAVKSFLRLLYVKTNGAINQNHFDILVNQAWFVPTFLDYFDVKDQIFNVPPYKKKLKTKTPNLQVEQSAMFDSDDKLHKALKLTSRKIQYEIGQRNKFIFSLACNCNRYGIPIGLALSFIKSNYDLGENEIERTVGSAYNNNPTEFKKYLNRITI